MPCAEPLVVASTAQLEGLTVLEVLPWPPGFRATCDGVSCVLMAVTALAVKGGDQTEEGAAMRSACLSTLARCCVKLRRWEECTPTAPRRLTRTRRTTRPGGGVVRCVINPDASLGKTTELLHAELAGWCSVQCLAYYARLFASLNLPARVHLTSSHHPVWLYDNKNMC